MNGYEIAAIITALATLVLALFAGTSLLNWSKRCHPRNPSFRPPTLFGRRDRGG